MRLYAEKGPKSILDQIIKLMVEGNKKIVQMKTLFHVLAHCCPMLEYETSYDHMSCFFALRVSNNLTMHIHEYVEYLLNVCRSTCRKCHCQSHTICLLHNLVLWWSYNPWQWVVDVFVHVWLIELGLFGMCW